MTIQGSDDYQPGEILPPPQGGYPPGDPRNAEPRLADARPAPRERSGWSFMSAPATYVLVGINVAVFVLMVLNGVSPMMPDTVQLLHWGANYGLYVLNGQYWRLLTATFVHVGIIHIATNMWCLWNLGLLGEPLLGPWGLVAVYGLTGIAGNLLSIAINPQVPGAGASGAVFGIAGVLIVLLSNKRLPIPWPELKRLRRSVIQFAVLNLVIGASTLAFHTSIRIDNMAHVGGFLSGLAIGVPLMPKMTLGRQKYLSRQKITFAISAGLLALFGYAIARVY